MSPKKRILIYAFGNPGRQDDGLGNRLIEKLEPWLKEKGFDRVATESNYQLNIEDAYTLKDKEVVVFVDARDLAENFGDVPSVSVVRICRRGTARFKCPVFTRGIRNEPFRQRQARSV